ncbi:MAG: CBS domain-containing protein [Planctomycetales bacterium]
MNLRTILSRKGRDVFTISSKATIAQAVESMVEHNCGSLVICDDGALAGIISERDILRAIAGGQRPLSAVLVEERMTRRVITGDPADDLNKIMGIMTEHRIRHLPVLESGRVIGLISIGDIVKAQHEELAVENHFLMSYIQS